MIALGISGSPRAGGNTDALLDEVMRYLRSLGLQTEVIRLRNLKMSYCSGCRSCLKLGGCVVKDEFTTVLVPALLKADVLVVASPVYFNNVSALTKTFIDRTWCLRGRLRNKVGGAVVVGRGYGLESAITAIHAFMLKHEIIVVHRGVHGVGFEVGEVLRDSRALRDALRLARRLAEVAEATAPLRARGLG